MQTITCKYCDTDTSHSCDHYYVRSGGSDDYLLMFFKTPFLYKKGQELLIGEKFHYLINPPYGPAEHGSYREGFVNDWIFFQGDLAKDIIDTFQLPINTPFYIGDHSLIASYIKEIGKERLLKHTCYEARISAIITDMLIDLGRQYSLLEQNTHPAFHTINNARNHMLAHVEEKIRLQDLAEYTQYSESRFCSLYRRFFSSSPIEDLLNARIEKAISLLKYGQLSVTEIAAACGFSSVHYFSRKFKEKTGLSPTDYIGISYTGTSNNSPSGRC